MVDSPATRPSLLVRLRDARDARAWAEFVDVYAPLVHGFCQKRGLQDADAADLTQEVLRRVSQAISRLDYDRRLGSFRGWLFTMVRRRLCDFHDRQQRQVRGTGDTSMMRQLSEMPDRDDGMEQEWEQDCRCQLYARAARVVRNDVTEATWRAFHATAVEGKPAPQVAAELSVNVAAVYLAKSRVMARLKAELAAWDEFAEGDSAW